MNERTKTGPNCKGSLPKATGKKLPRVIPGYRGTAIHQDDACVAPTIAAFIDGPCRGEACLALVPSSIPVRGMASSVPGPGLFPSTGVPQFTRTTYASPPQSLQLSTAPVGARHASPCHRHASRSRAWHRRSPHRILFPSTGVPQFTRATHASPLQSLQLSTAPVGARHASPWCRHSSRSRGMALSVSAPGVFPFTGCRNSPGRRMRRPCNRCNYRRSL
jgi:hypothetical protein